MSNLVTVDEVTPLCDDHLVSASDKGKKDVDRGGNYSQLESGMDSLNVHIHKGNIGMLGSIAIMVNSLTGPAMLNLPSTFQKSGLIPTTMSLVLLCGLSSLCSSHMANVISKVPGNSKFQKEIEYSDVFRHFWGERGFIFTQFFFFCCITCLNVASIVDTAQVVDQIISRTIQKGTMAFRYENNVTHSSYGLESVWWSHEACIEEHKETLAVGGCIPFEEDSSHPDYLLTAGYLVSCLLFLPLSLKDLKENALFQIVGFIVLIVVSIQFVTSFLLHGLSFSNATLWGYDWSDMFGVILFNFAVVIAIPAWLYEKKATINVNPAIYSSSLISFVLYCLVGGLGALTTPNVADNMLQTLMAGGFGNYTEIFAEIFVFFIIGLGIPLFSVLARLNLTGSGLCSEFVANLLAVYIPWGISWVFYSGGATGILGWGGIFFTSIIAFLAPLLLAIYSVMKFDVKGSIAIHGEYFHSKRAQLIALGVLLLFSVMSIILAILGELYS